MAGSVKIKRHSATKTAIKVPKVIKGKTSTKQSNLCQNLPTLIDLRTGAISVARSEAWYWTKYGLTEGLTESSGSDALSLSRLKEFYLAAIALSRLEDYYLAAIDQNRPNTTPKADADDRAKDASEDKRPWSAAFISYCYVKAYENLNPVKGWTLRDYAKCLRDNNLFSANVGHAGYVDSALRFRGPQGKRLYKKVKRTKKVKVGDWIYVDRKKDDGTKEGTHVDIVLEIFETETKDRANNLITRKWALATGGNIYKKGETAGFKIYSLNAKGKLKRNNNPRHRPNDGDLYESIKLNLNQIKSWPNVNFNLMKGLVRLF